MPKQRRVQSSLLPASPLLITESEDEFDRIRDALDQELKPRGIVEQMYVADVAYLAWEILRLRRCKAGIVNSSFLQALERLLEQFLRQPGGFNLHVREEAERLARAWFSGPAGKKDVEQLLKDFQLDETAIEAEAVRCSIDQLEQLDRLLASLESRRNKALRCVAEYRGGLARQLRDSSDRIIEGNKVLALEHAPGKKSSAAA